MLLYIVIVFVLFNGPLNYSKRNTPTDTIFVYQLKRLLPFLKKVTFLRSLNIVDTFIWKPVHSILKTVLGFLPKFFKKNIIWLIATLFSLLLIYFPTTMLIDEFTEFGDEDYD
jgi:hypothetical protein